MNGRSLIFALGLSAVAEAHPLGNFTINRYAGLRVNPTRLAVRYVVDMAEIPAFQAISSIDRNGNGIVDADERDGYLARMAGELARGLSLTIDGAALALTPGPATLELPPGAGGLPTLRLEVLFAAPLPAARGAVELRDRNFAGRPGWQEIVADSGEGLALIDSTVPRTDRSDALRAYPADQLQSPPQVTEARFRIAAGAGPGPAPRAPAAARVGASRFSDRLTELVASRAPLGLWLVLTSLLVAAGLGALHALGPGHGKTIVGAYLVGAHGTARHALVLGLVVTATHTLGVYLLGVVTLAASHYVLPERLFPWLSACAGLLVVAIGTSLAASRLGAVLDAEHEHAHSHGGGHHHGHSHELPTGGGERLAWRRLLALGVSGGLLPCPSALVVMLGAVALGRVAFGLLLIVAFSVGLAAVLTVIGLAFVYARRWFDRLPVGGRLARYVPVASALVVSLAGLLIVAQALAQLGLLRAAT